MADQTNIEWCDRTFSPWQGCEKISPGCKFCYAEAFSRWTVPGHWGKNAPRRFRADDYWSKPHKWNVHAAKTGVRERVFVASVADVFEDRPDLVPHRQRLFETIRDTPRLDWMLLSKRPENAARMLPWMLDGSEPWRNVWIGATGEDDQHARKRSIAVAEVRAVVRFMSYEPALSSVEWQHVLPGVIDWLIIGGESGPGAREFQVAWAREALAAARRHGVVPFVKQLGRFPRADGRLVQLRSDKKKGGDMAEWEPDLRVREWPTPLGV